ncbi:hypothetical protein E2542_SST10705 [Spatholobus suberectus]|nr:hypothetical protein E2542_SST10705 [Spatholobus suberectus]
MAVQNLKSLFFFFCRKKIRNKKRRIRPFMRVNEGSIKSKTELTLVQFHVLSLFLFCDLFPCSSLYPCDLLKSHSGLFGFHVEGQVEKCLSSREAMEGGRSNSTAPGTTASELEALQKEHEEKNLKIQELKRQIELTKHLLEKKKKEVTEEQMGGFNTLSKKYNSLREEYNAMLAEKLRESK